MSDFLDNYGLACLLIFTFLSFIVWLVGFVIPFFGVDYQILAYAAGDTSCLLRQTNHCLFIDDIEERIESVYEIGGNYYIEIGEKYVELGDLMK